MRDYQEVLKDLTDEDIDLILKNETVTVDFDGGRLDITPDMVDVRIESKEGFNVGMQNNKFIILNTELTEELILEGLARELVSKVQNLRKTSGLEIENRIKLYYFGDDRVNKAIETFVDFIKKETLSVEVIKDENLEESVDLNGHKTLIKIEKNN